MAGFLFVIESTTCPSQPPPNITPKRIGWLMALLLIKPGGLFNETSQRTVAYFKPLA